MKNRKNTEFDRVTVTRTVTSEDDYSVIQKNTDLTPGQIEAGLMSGGLNLVQHSIVEQLSFITDMDGKTLVVLSHDGGSGPDHTVTVTIPGREAK